MLTLNKGLSVSPALSVSRCTRSQEGSQPGQMTQIGQRDIPYHGESAPYIICAELPRRGQSLLGNRVGISQKIVSNCIVGHLFFLWFIRLSLSFFISLFVTITIILIIIIIICYVILIFTVLISVHEFYFFPILLPIPQEEGGGRNEVDPTWSLLAIWG